MWIMTPFPPQHDKSTEKTYKELNFVFINAQPEIRHMVRPTT